MPIVPAGFAAVTMVASIEGDDEDVTWSDGVEASGSADDLANAIFGVWAAEWNGLMHESYTLQRCVIETATTIGESTATPVTGGGTGLVSPQNVAYLVDKNTGLRGRKNQGRFFLPGVIATDIEPNGTIDSSAHTLLQAVFDDLFDNINGLAAVERHVLLHSLLADAPTTVVSWVLDQKVATQRRRLR